mgnify:CR=1 FL=1
MLKIPSVILSTVPEGPLTGPARACQALLTDPARCMALIVTLAEDLPASESKQLCDALTGMAIPRGPLVVNRLYAPRFNRGPNLLALNDALALPMGEAGGDLFPLLSAARLAHERSTMNEEYLEQLKSDLPLPQVRLPHLFRPRFDSAAIDELAERLGGQLAGLSL